MTESAGIGDNIDIIKKIKTAKTMKEMDSIRMDVIHAKTNESLLLWQKKYRGLKHFRKPADIGYKYELSRS